MDILTYIVRTKALRIFNIKTEPTNWTQGDGLELLTLSFTGSIYINGDDYVVTASYIVTDTVSGDDRLILDDLASRAVLPKVMKIAQVKRGSSSAYPTEITDQYFVSRKVAKPLGNLEHHVDTFADYSEAIEFQMRHGGELREMHLTAVPTGCDPDRSHTESLT